jgi:hypothetical protein
LVEEEGKFGHNGEVDAAILRGFLEKGMLCWSMIFG